MTNPGFIPKQIPPFARGPYKAPTMTVALQGDPSKDNCFSKKCIEVPHQGALFRFRYCKICNKQLGQILRPPRCSHCYVCGMCVEGHDHHCPWVGTCVGKRNYTFYYTLLVSLLLYAIASVCICLLWILEIGSLDRVLVHLCVVILAMLVIIPFAGFVLGLLSFHSYLLCWNLTTAEAVKHSWKGKQNPFARGLCRNLKNRLATVWSQYFFDHQKIPLPSNLFYFELAFSSEAVLETRAAELKPQPEGLLSASGFSAEDRSDSIDGPRQRVADVTI